MRRIHIKESSRRLDPKINEEDIDYSQIDGNSTTCNFKNILYNALIKNASIANRMDNIPKLGQKYTAQEIMNLTLSMMKQQ